MKQITLLVTLWHPDQFSESTIVDEVQQILDMSLEHGLCDAEVYLDLDEGEDESE